MCKLTDKQAQFIEEYLVDLNATRAAKAAGYSAKNADKIGSELLGKTGVHAAIQTALAERSKRTELTADWVVGNLREVAERCMQKVPVMHYDKEEKDYVQDIDPDTGEGVWEFNANGANKALELLGKHLGIYKEQLAVSGRVGIDTVVITRAPDANE